MTDLERPIKHSLTEPEIDANALWLRIEARRRAFAPARKPATRYLGFAAALGAVFGLAALGVIQVAPHVRRAFADQAARIVTAPLTRANGEALGVFDTTRSGAALDVALSDGSQLRLGVNVRLVTRVAGPHEVRFVVVYGRATFDVKPHGPRRWVIEAGDTEVAVIGTRFSVEYEDTGLTKVAVERGRVEVRGRRVPEGVRALGAGEQLVVLPPAPSPPAVAVASPPPAATPATPQPAPAPAVRRATPVPASNGRRTQPADPLRAARDPMGSSTDDTRPTAAALFKRADAARLRGDYADAEVTLQVLLSQYPDDARAALAALTLGRLQLEHLGAARAAAASFALADRLGLPAAVAEEGAARLVEAYAKCGERALAVAAAARYRQRFPGGPRSANVAAWTNFD